MRTPTPIHAVASGIRYATGCFPPKEIEESWQISQVQDGDYCDSVSSAQNIALKDFYFLNPEINANCTNLLPGLAYCVQPVRDIAIYDNYLKTTNSITLTSASYSTMMANATQPFLLPNIDSRDRPTARIWDNKWLLSIPKLRGLRWLWCWGQWIGDSDSERL